MFLWQPDLHQISHGGDAASLIAWTALAQQ